MAFQPGEIYFVRESSGWGFGPYVKIGLVAQKKDRGSFERLKEHQTGNPRVLRIDPDQIVKTQAVSMVEAQLHKIFAPKRVSGEWFNFPEEHELEEAISEARKLAREIEELVPVFEQAEKLSKEESLSEKVAANDDSIELSQIVIRTSSEVSILETLEKRIQAAFEEAVESGDDLKGAAKVVTRTFQPVFKLEEFKSEHEDLYRKYIKMESTWSGTFRPSGKKLSLDDLTQDFQQQIHSIQKQIDEVTSPSEAYLLNEPQLVITNLKAIASWEHDIALAKLKILCGDNAGIEGICTWNRKFSDPKEVFDVVKFVEENPELYVDYLAEAKTGTYIRRVKRKA